MKGQITISEYLSARATMRTCSQCICRDCLYLWSGRCLYGECYDDRRAKENPYDKAHPDKSPRTQWSDWNKPGEQAHWCRGGILYPEYFCDKYVHYEGQKIEDCVKAPISVFQDGFIDCSLKSTIGCERCIEEAEQQEHHNKFDCPYMTDTGCERMYTAKSLILDAIAAGEDEEICREQCCIGCMRSCGYRCGQAMGGRGK